MTGISNNDVAPDLTEASLEAAIAAMRRDVEAAGSKVMFRPTQVLFPPGTVTWLDESAPAGWRDRIKGYRHGDNLIALIFDEPGLV